MRYRVKDDRTQCVETQTQYNVACDKVTNVTTYSCGYLGSIIETWDVVTPNFAKRRKAGELIVNPYRHTESRWYNSINGVITLGPPLCPDGSSGRDQHDGPQLTRLCEANPTQHGALIPSWVLSQDDVDRLIDISATKAWSAAAGNETQILVFLAELKKTIHDLAHPLENLSKFLNKVLGDKRKDPRAFAKTLTVAEYLQREWLRYRFGIRPLISDIRGIVKAIRKDRRSGRRTARGFATNSRSSSVRKTIDHGGEFRTTYDLTIDHTCNVRSGFVYDAELSVRDSLGLQFQQIPATVWELISYSFVIDWFFNVGDWVNALIPYGTTDAKGAFTTIEHIITVSRVVVGTIDTNSGANTWTLQRPMSGTETLLFRDKQRLASIRPPSLAKKLSLSDISLSDLRILDSLALIKQKLGAR